MSASVSFADMSSEAWNDFARELAAAPRPLSLTDADVAAIEHGAGDVCALARARVLKAAGRAASGLALQRSAWRLADRRERMVALTFEAAVEDEEFQRLVGSADAARDRGDWPGSEHAYAAALALYPLHHGYRVQYAHMLKEQDEFAAAEANYRTALALGALEADVARHLAFVSARQGWHGEPPDTGAFSDDPLREPPTLVDLETLAYVLWRQDHVDAEDAVDLLRNCATCEAAVARMMADERFVLRNQAFLQLYGAST